MKNRFWLILIGLLLAGSLWMVSINAVSAQEEEATQEVVEAAAEEENTNAGPGAFIILLGLGAVLLVGFTYMARQNNNTVSSN
ncbi:MAG: hypothetical protein K8I82_20705 [Anaerolineae bacterium]|nr:hypothetical protein [Anaerolineae bacterium]